MEELKNDRLTIKVHEKGAELVSIIHNGTGQEYIWNANPDYWQRHSPILFPIVGSLWNNTYKLDNKKLELPQHGFARDMPFVLTNKTENTLLYRLTNNKETEKGYPFSFVLELGYKLTANHIEVLWAVKNTGDCNLYFQIGAHPAFNYPNFNASEKTKGYLAFDKHISLIHYTSLGAKGCIPKNNLKDLRLTENLFELKSDSFDTQAMIIENRQLSVVSLLDKNKKSYLTVRFDAPVVGLWSPPHKNAPFICIEPWFGRCDYIGYEGDFKNKDWMNKLSPSEEFRSSYFIDIDY